MIYCSSTIICKPVPIRAQQMVRTVPVFQYQPGRERGRGCGRKRGIGISSDDLAGYDEAGYPKKALNSFYREINGNV